MSYRTLKKMLGENSLERKCLFLFGGGLLLLITSSFYLYAWLNESWVIDQNLATVGAPFNNDNGKFSGSAYIFSVDLEAPDCNENGVPDSCEPDCNGNGVADWPWTRTSSRTAMSILLMWWTPYLALQTSPS